MLAVVTELEATAQLKILHGFSTISMWYDLNHSYVNVYQRVSQKMGSAQGWLKAPKSSRPS